MTYSSVFLLVSWISLPGMITCDPPRASSAQRTVELEFDAALLECLGSLEVLTATESPRLSYHATLAAASLADLRSFIERIEKRPHVAIAALELKKTSKADLPWRTSVTLVAHPLTRPHPRLSTFLGFLDFAGDDNRYEIQSLVLRSSVNSRDSSHVQFSVPTFRESVELTSRLRSSKWFRDLKSQYKKRDAAQDLLNLSFRVSPSRSARKSRL